MILAIPLLAALAGKMSTAALIAAVFSAVAAAAATIWGIYYGVTSLISWGLGQLDTYLADLPSITGAATATPASDAWGTVSMFVPLDFLFTMLSFYVIWRLSLHALKFILKLTPFYG